MWTAALEEMLEQDRKIFGPTSFINYCRENNINPPGGTANCISIDHYERLNKQLKDNSCMVLRLGSSNARNGTDFTLIKYEQLRDFFFFDSEIFTSEPVKREPPQNVRNALSIINIFDRPSEMMLVTYLLSSGVLSDVLGLDKDDAYYTPLTGRNCFTFSYKPVPGFPELVHVNGQVEIDAVFTGKRNGKPVIVVAEAKGETGRYSSLAKHKLFYAYKSLKQVCKKRFDVIPVYMKLGVQDGYLKARIAECVDGDGSLVGMEVVKANAVQLEL